MSSYRDREFDNLIHHSLQSACGGAEPSPAIWERIVGRVSSLQYDPPGRPLMRGLIKNLKHNAVLVEHRLFSVPVQYERLAEQRARFYNEFLACPGALCIPLSVV